MTTDDKKHPVTAGELIMEAARVPTVSQSSLTQQWENSAATLAAGSFSAVNLALNNDREAEHADLIRADLKEQL